MLFVVFFEKLLKINIICFKVLAAIGANVGEFRVLINIGTLYLSCIVSNNYID